MDLVPLSPLPVASLLWASSSGLWTFTVVCKATYLLAPDLSPLHEEQEAPNEDDSHWDDSSNRSLWSPSDLVPFKARAEVMLVGQAFAPGGRSVRSLVARMIVGDQVDKSIEVFGKRAWAQDGQLQEGQEFSSMSLVYERAAGGPDTWNPVGVRLGAGPDAQGNSALPNLQPPGMKLSRRGDFVPPIGFGPIAPEWRLRSDRLGPYRGAFSAKDWRHRGVPDDLDPGYFNAAPEDQQVEAIRSDERIVLENLHQAYPRLVTSLPGVRPRAFVEKAGEGPEEVILRCDTLWIDTAQGICALVWRGHVPVAGQEQQGRVLVGMEERGQRVGWVDLARMAGGPMERERGEWMSRGEKQVGAATVMLDVVDGTRTMPVDPEAVFKAITPFPEAVPKAIPPFSELPPPPVVFPPSFVPPPPLVAPPEAPAAKPGSKIGAWRSPGSENAGNVPSDTDARGSPGGLLAASNAAADPQLRPEERVVRAAPARGRPGEAIELIWFDPKMVAKMRRHPAWKKILVELKESRAKGKEEDGEEESREKRQEARDRRDVAGILRKGEAIDRVGIENALAEAMEEEAFTPPLVLVAGELEMPFDELEVLKAMLVAVAPFAPGDKKLKETVDMVGEMMKTAGIERARGVVEGLIGRVREAFGQVGRGVSAGYLEGQTEPMLLEGRCYQKRAVMGDSWLRAVLRVAGDEGRGAVPAYLAEGLAKELPMFRKFRVRVLGEARERVDQGEAAGVALKVLALGRRLTGR